MFKNKKEKMEKSKIEKLVSRQETEDRYILDDENAIIVIHGDEPTGYIMIHERLINNELVEINRWSLICYYFGSIHDVTTIKDLNLFQVQNGCGNFNAIYNYKEGKFVVPQKTWGLVESGRNNSILKKYNGFLASFGIRSDYEEDDVYAYDNPITGERIVESFVVEDGDYYAILNIDGTIRGNKLFKGKSFSKITKIIDLDEYESLDAFKKERKQLCNDKKQKSKQEYYQLVESRNDGSISPYLDSEVAKVLNLKK